MDEIKSFFQKLSSIFCASIDDWWFQAFTYEIGTDFNVEAFRKNFKVHVSSRPFTFHDDDDDKQTKNTKD